MKFTLCRCVGYIVGMKWQFSESPGKLWLRRYLGFNFLAVKKWLYAMGQSEPFRRWDSHDLANFSVEQEIFARLRKSREQKMVSIILALAQVARYLASSNHPFYIGWFVFAYDNARNVSILRKSREITLIKSKM